MKSNLTPSFFAESSILIISWWRYEYTCLHPSSNLSRTIATFIFSFQRSTLMENERKKKSLPNNLFVTNVAIRSCVRWNYHCVTFKVQYFVLTFRRFLKLNSPKPVFSIWMYLTTSIRKFTSEIIPWEVILLVSHDQLSNVTKWCFSQ